MKEVLDVTWSQGVLSHEGVGGIFADKAQDYVWVIIQVVNNQIDQVSLCLLSSITSLEF
jgi:hypothetical protein